MCWAASAGAFVILRRARLIARTCLLGSWTCESCCGDHRLAERLWETALNGPVEALHTASCQATS